MLINCWETNIWLLSLPFRYWLYNAVAICCVKIYYEQCLR